MSRLLRPLREYAPPMHLMAILAGAALASMVSFLTIKFKSQGEELSYYEEWTVYIAVGALTIALLSLVVRSLLGYLESGERSAETQQKILNAKLANLVGEVDRVKQDVGFGLTDDERAALVEKLLTSVRRTASEDFMKDIRQEAMTAIEGRAKQDAAAAMRASTVSRLNAELASVTKRGNLNLVLGIGMALAGILMMGYFLITSAPTGDPVEFGERFVPRFTLVVLIEIFAYFFLRLYSSSLTETKYYQNELTNIDAQYLALQSAADMADEKMRGKVISILAKTERNFVLQKGQSTIALEQSRLANEESKNIAQRLAKLLDKKS